MPAMRERRNDDAAKIEIQTETCAKDGQIGEKQQG
jgi:hypothetical protein